MREFPMTDRNFAQLKSIAYKLTGINLTDHKKNMVYGRLARRLRRLHISDFDTYVDLVSQDASPEHVEFVNAITTNLTSFFREGHHFDYLTDTVIPGLMRRNLASRRIRFWSAGCSTGEEAYSIAMVLKSISALSNWDVKVLATDLDSNVVDRGRAGIYPLERAEKIPEKYRRFLSSNAREELVKVKHSVQELVTFRQLNLLHEWPMKGPFDVIFCRNVVIYFDAETQRRLFDRYANLMIPDGHLFIGHSENLHNITTRFKSLGRTIYQRNQ